MFEVRVETSFSSAHRLLNYKGKCENLHGHNWKVEVSVKGNVLDKSNILVDFKVLKERVNQVIEYLDHKDLNNLEEFKGISVSSEIIAKYIYDEIKKSFPDISKVSVYETMTSCATYYETED